MLLATVLVKGSGFVYRAITARRLGTTQYGHLSLGLMLISMGSIVALAGLHSTVRRYLPEYVSEGKEAKIKGILLSLFCIIGAVSAISVAILWVNAEFVASSIFGDRSLVDLVRVFALGIPFAAALQFSQKALLGLQKYKGNAIVRILGRGGVLNVIVAAIALFLGASVFVVSVIYILSIAVAFLIAAVTIAYSVKDRVNTTAPKYDFNRWFKFGIPLLFSSSVGLVLSWSDTFMIGLLQSSADVGKYNTAYPFSMLLTSLIPIFGSVFVPRGSELLSQDRQREVAQLFETIRYTIFLFVAPGVLFILFNSEHLLLVVFGPEYTSVSDVFIIISVANFAVCVTGPTTALLQVFEQSNELLRTNVLGATVNIILNIILIPRYGLPGAAMAYGFSVALISYLLYWQGVRRCGSSDFSQTYFQPLLIAILWVYSASILMEAYEPQLALTVLIGFTTLVGYFGLLSALDIVDFDPLLEI